MSKLHDCYSTFTLRNIGYFSTDLQAKIRDCSVLIAGCGMGSSIAEVLLRTGFCKLILVDRDVVEAHNLNRQIFTNSDIGKKKVRALASRLSAVFPDAEITEIDDFVSRDNVKDLIAAVDFVVDTIDFLDLPAITYLHDEAHRAGKPLLSAVSAGKGCVCYFFPPNDEPSCGFRKLFRLPEFGSVDHLSYLEVFRPFVQSLRSKLDSEVVTAMNQALEIMQDGTHCPAPQLAIGATTVASVAATVAVRFLEGQPIKTAPEPIIISLGQLV